MSTPADIHHLHRLYCDLTEQSGFSLRFDRQRMWWDWLSCGWGEDDLKLVVRYLRRGIVEGKRNPGCLKFSNLIGQADRFEEDLYEARRIIRPTKPKMVTARQPLPGGGERQVEMPRPDEEAVQDIGAMFEELRRKLAAAP